VSSGPEKSAIAEVTEFLFIFLRSKITGAAGARAFQVVEARPCKYLVVRRGIRGLFAQIEHFVQVVRGEDQATITGQDGYKALELIVATLLAITRPGYCDAPTRPRTRH